MVTRTIEIEDNLDEIVESVKDDVNTEIENYIKENEEKPDFGNLDYSGAIHEIIDSAVPIHTNEINNLFFLYGNEMEQSFDNAGIGKKNDDSWPMGWKAAAIYCYIDEQLMNDLDDMIDELWDKYEESLPKEE